MTSRTDFDALVRRAGLSLGEAQAAELYGAFLTLDTLIERLRTPLPRAAEPATMFDAVKSSV